MSEKAAFQESQELCFDTILDVYGQDAVWHKTGGDVTEQALFNDPTKDARFQITSGRGLSHVGYDNQPITRPYIEYRKGQFVGLYELVYEQNVNQYLTVNGTRYVCSQTESFFDGQTYRISLQVATTDEVIPGV